MPTDQVVALLGHFGFPIFVATWLMIRTDAFIRENTRVTVELMVLLKALGQDKRG